MGYPKVQFIEPSCENLANYLCHLAKQISCGFYQGRRFLVLSHLIEKESRAIYFPDLPYTTKFWGNFASLKQNSFVFNSAGPHPANGINTIRLAKQRKEFLEANE